MINVDISNVWGRVSLPDLLALEKEVFDAHMTLTEGSGEGNDFLGWLNLPVEEETEEIRRIRAAAKQIRDTEKILECYRQEILRFLELENITVGVALLGDP